MANEINQTQTDNLKQSVSSETVKFLFAKFLARYGSKWSCQYPADMLKIVHEEWLMELNHLTIEDIKRGIDSWKGDFPPNIVEFKKECMPAPCYRTWGGRGLPPPRNKDVAKKAISKLKEMLS